ncbi:interferon-stimulated 20 kDa exonuclease-like 2 [Austrofundulus limnaeus]|uniref:Interferon-stimulated 20 kDa exonuclease-like 2 n=1 Tax=Austrofundulus limnaeus TaxID=52670 RepID=A0A2I4CJ52_AUSLI|nr:PREDICTED: interferon-stimulated 20 kDa exonuclease-like 2 [Austrofundulus limnaeus]
MSDLMFNVCSLDDTSQGSHPTAKGKKKSNRFHKRMKYLQAKGYLRDKQNKLYQKDSKNPHQDGSKTENGAPTTASAFRSSAIPSASPHNLPSKTITVKGRYENTKESTNTRETSPRPSVSGCLKPPTALLGNPTKYLAIDCEMVGSGPKGSINQLARCSLVSYDGDVVYDKYIKPSMPVTNYRTRWSGIRPRDLTKATPFSEARKEILKLLMGNVVVGHAIHNDFKALSYLHPSVLTRDTSKIPLLNLKAGFGEKECASLKRLTKAIFNRDIQVGRKGHCSVEDAKATMELYKVVQVEWERTLLSKSLAT